jgi:transposase
MSQDPNQSPKQERRAPRSYDEEFRQEAIRLSINSGKSSAEVARELGISVNTLNNWRRQARLKHQLPTPDHESIEQQLKRLHKENEQLKQERDILKKAMAYFAQPPQK